MIRTTRIQDVFRIVLGVGMIYTGLAHLTFARNEYIAQVPTWITQDPSFADIIILFSGVIEIILGLIMIFKIGSRYKAGIALGVFFIIIFPGNINQYVNHISAFGLDTDLKRLIRLFFQPVLIIWALWTTGALQYFKEKEHDDHNHH